MNKPVAVTNRNRKRIDSAGGETGLSVDTFSSGPPAAAASNNRLGIVSRLTTDKRRRLLPWQERADFLHDS